VLVQNSSTVHLSKGHRRRGSRDLKGDRFVVIRFGGLS